MPTVGASASADLAAEIARLDSLDHDNLQRLWRIRLGRKIPGHLPRYLLLRLLAYRFQAAVHGDLDRDTGRLIDQIRLDGARSSLAQDIVPIRLKPGSLLMREHEGELHRVMVLDKGFTWNGKTYASLSEVAFAISGTRWNGPRFFGLRSASKRHSNAVANR